MANQNQTAIRWTSRSPLWQIVSLWGGLSNLKQMSWKLRLWRTNSWIYATVWSRPIESKDLWIHSFMCNSLWPLIDDPDVLRTEVMTVGWVGWISKYRRQYLTENVWSVITWQKVSITIKAVIRYQMTQNNSLLIYFIRFKSKGFSLLWSSHWITRRLQSEGFRAVADDCKEIICLFNKNRKRMNLSLTSSLPLSPSISLLCLSVCLSISL